MTWFINGGDPLSSVNYCADPITGKSMPVMVTDADLTVENVLHPQTSTTTNFDSALICATGKMPDDGSKCN
jgi:hypothetical protein